MWLETAIIFKFDTFSRTKQDLSFTVRIIFLRRLIIIIPKTPETGR